MRAAAAKNVAKKVAANKAYHDKSKRAHEWVPSVGDKILVRRGQFGNKMHGRLAYRYNGPFEVSRVLKKGIEYFNKEGRKHSAHPDMAKPFRDRQLRE